MNYFDLMIGIILIAIVPLVLLMTYLYWED